MNKKYFLFPILGFGLLMGMTACMDSDDNDGLYQPTALVTVCPEDDGSFVMQLDRETQLVAANVKTSPFGDKEVRALVNYSEIENAENQLAVRKVHVNWIDSIRTKLPVKSLGEENNEKFGNDPIEIVRDWVTVAEDGYLTLRVRTLWGPGQKVHSINLVSGTNPENPHEFELRHNAFGDTNGEWGDALIAFNLNNLLGFDAEDSEITLKWKSFEGEKSVKFDMEMRPWQEMNQVAAAGYTSFVD